MRMTLVTAPQAFVGLTEARQQCRVPPDEESDEVLRRAIVAAISYLDGYRGVLRRCIVTQQWKMDLPFPGRRVALPFPDISEVVATFADDVGGAVAHDLSADGRGIYFATQYRRPVEILITAGFGPVESVPGAIRQAALMLVDHFYRQRGGLSEGPGIPPEVDAMISPFKVWRL